MPRVGILMEEFKKPTILKCEVCGKLYPKGTVCCGVGTRNRAYLKEDFDEPELSR